MDEPLPQSEFFKVTINRDTLNGGSSSSRKRTEAEAFGTDDYIALGFEETSGQEEEDEADLEAVHEVLRGLHGRERDSTAEPVSKRLRGEVDTRPPWIADEASFSGESEVSMRLHREVQDFVALISPTPEEHAMRSLVIERVKRCVTEFWSDAELCVFGSFDTRLYLPNGDIDLVVLSKTSRKYGEARDIRALANRLRKAGLADPNSIQLVLKARVPIIKFTDVQTQIALDISFERPSGIVTADYSRRMLNLLPALRPLVIIVKYFLYTRTLNVVYKGGLGSYSILCLCISFLNLHPRVASGYIAAEENLGVMVMEWLELYGKRFANEHVGIDVANASYFDRLFPPASLAPATGRTGSSVLQIIDPTEPSNDVSRSSHNYSRVKQAFSTAFDVLTARIYRINSYLQGWDEVPEDERSNGGTILGGLFEMEREVLEARKEITNAWTTEVKKGTRLEDYLDRQFRPEELSLNAHEENHTSALDIEHYLNMIDEPEPIVSTLPQKAPKKSKGIKANGTVKVKIKRSLKKEAKKLKVAEALARSNGSPDVADADNSTLSSSSNFRSINVDDGEDSRTTMLNMSKDKRSRVGAYWRKKGGPLGNKEASED